MGIGRSVAQASSTHIDHAKYLRAHDADEENWRAFQRCQYAMVVAIARLIYIIDDNVLCSWVVLNEDTYLRFQRSYVDVGIENAISATCEQALNLTFWN